MGTDVDVSNFLEVYGIDRANLLAQIEALNGFEHTPYKIIVEGKTDFQLVACFIAVMHAIPADYGKLTPIDAVKLYEGGLPESLFSEGTPITTEVEGEMLVLLKSENVDESANAVAETPTEDASATPEAGSDETHECPVFGNQNMEEPDCKDCKNQFPEEFAACTAKTAEAAAPTTKKKGRKAKTPKEPKAPKTPKEPKPPKEPKEKVVVLKSRYGHQVNTMSGDIDECLWVGGHIDQITSYIAAKHGKELSAARSKIRGHISHLIQVKNIAVLETEGVLKAQVEFGANNNAANTYVPENFVLPEYVAPVAPPAEPASTEAGTSQEPAAE